jgi:hypothetical protein
MTSIISKTAFCILTAAILTACGYNKSGPTDPAPIDDKATLEKLADNYKKLAEKFPRSPMQLPPGERKAFVEQVFINSGYSYDATLHAMATADIDFSKKNVTDLAELLTIPQRNAASPSDVRSIYSQAELKDMAALERRMSQ